MILLNIMSELHAGARWLISSFIVTSTEHRRILSLFVALTYTGRASEQRNRKQTKKKEAQNY